jgi:hypothetical protein
MTQSRGSYDMDRTPIVNTGTRASIIYPNQGAPVMPGTAPPPQYRAPGSNQQPGQAPGTGAAVPPGGPAPGTPNSSEVGAPPQANAQPEAPMTYLGGARTDEQRHVEVSEDPLVIKYLTAPIALLAAPFVLAKEAMTDEREPGPPIPRRSNPTVPQSSSASAPIARQPDYESTMLQSMERELDQRSESVQPGENSQRQFASARSSTPSIADELEALQRAPELPRAPSHRVNALSDPTEHGSVVGTGNL